MAGSRDLKRRLKSIGNISQITHAMQLVAASKMRKAQKRSKDADAYAYGVLEILENITARLTGVPPHHFFAPQSSDRVRLVLITPNRGFCGGLTVNLTQTVMKFIKQSRAEGKQIDAVTIGKKGASFLRKINLPISADFPHKDEYIAIKDIFPIAQLITEDYLSKKHGAVYIAFTQFLNTLNQRPMFRKILPIEIATFRELAEIDAKTKEFFFSRDTIHTAQYIFEPDVTHVFERLIPELIHVEIYKALLETHASEHSARMIAMKNATDKAKEVISDLRLAYNQERQAGITREIAEVSSGALASS